MKVSVGHLEFQVRRPTPTETADLGNAMGCCYSRRGVILLQPGFTPQEEAATLMHEVIHAIWWAYRMPDRRLDQEAVCCHLEGPLVQFYADNPQVVAALIAARGGVPLNLE